MFNHKAILPAVAALALLMALPECAEAQFNDPGQQSNVVERLTGQLLSAEGEPTPEPGDQLAVFFEDQILGVFNYTSGQVDPLEYDILIFGDDPDTEDVVEGPEVGQPIRFRFFDSSTNQTRTDLAVLNAQGEQFNLTFQGEFTFTIPIMVPGAPPFPDAPAREFDVLLGAEGTGGNNGGGGGGGGSGGSAEEPNYDVNNDGSVNKKDAAIVLRVVIGASRAVSAADLARADVNGDGVVNTGDVIEIMRNR